MRGAAAGGDLTAAHQSYFGQPVLKRPHWDWKVVAYLFIGGIMGGSGILAALADGSRDKADRTLARSSRYLSLSLAAISPVMLIAHLGRPERFHHMLRIFKLKSVMSMGVWGLLLFSNVALVNAAHQLAEDGKAPRAFRALPRAAVGLMQAGLGAFMAGYTGVLLSATAIPLWAKGKRHIPAISVCSSVASACAANAIVLALVGGPARTISKLERLEFVAACAEAVLLLHFRRHAGESGEAMFSGHLGQSLRNFTLIGGLALPMAHNGMAFAPLRPTQHGLRTILVSALTLMGGYVFRYVLIEAGKASADDPQLALRPPQ